MSTQTNAIPTARKRALSTAVALMAQRYKLDRLDTDAAVFVAALHLEAGNTAGAAYDQARQLACRLRKERAQRKVINLIDRIKANMPAL